MKLSELENAEQLVTKDYLNARLEAFGSQIQARLAELETRMTDRLMASERATRSLIFGAYGLIFGTYALIIAAVYVNHFWR